MTLGQEFDGYATTLGEDHRPAARDDQLLSEVNLGATAIGTGITADPGYAAAVCATSPRSPASHLDREPHRGHPASRRLHDVPERPQGSAIKLSKICNDLRLMSSGPQAGPRRDHPAAAPGRLVDHAGQVTRSSPRP